MKPKERYDVIVDTLSLHTGLSFWEVSEITGIKKSELNGDLSRLIDQGRIAATGSTYDTKYHSVPHETIKQLVTQLWTSEFKLVAV